jgi:primosomal protein N'
VAAPGQQARKRAGRGAAASLQPAASLPVAQVAVDVSLPHLDRPFEYLVPESLAEAATVGCRVRVRFAGRLTGGFVLKRTADSEHQGRLGYLERVVSPEPVLTPEIAGLARAVADRYGGTLADVLRLAVPPRHAAAESAVPAAAVPAAAGPAAGPPAAAPVPAGTEAPSGHAGDAGTRAVAGSQGPGAGSGHRTGDRDPARLAPAVALAAVAAGPAARPDPAGPPSESGTGMTVGPGAPARAPAPAAGTAGLAAGPNGDAAGPAGNGPGLAGDLGGPGDIAPGAGDIAAHDAARSAWAAAAEGSTAGPAGPAASAGPAAGTGAAGPAAGTGAAGPAAGTGAAGPAAGTGAAGPDAGTGAAGPAEGAGAGAAGTAEEAGAAGAGEAMAAGTAPPGPVRPAGGWVAGSWDRYAAGASFLSALAAGRAPRAVWSALPGASWPGEIAAAAAAAASAGRGVVIVVPDARDLERVDGALTAALGPAAHVILSASLGPAERYRRWLAAERGQVQVVAGTRSAMFAPVRDLGLVVLWDEGDDLLAEPRAPYPHAREVLALRAHRAGAAALIGGFARTAEAAQLLAGGWARSLAAERGIVRRWAPAVLTAGEDSELARDEAARSARLPGLALRTAREALARGPVLFQVPRSGYLAAVACERCHAQVRCQCGGPAQLAGARATPRCAWCGSAVSPACPQCGHGRLRALVTGATRTAEELGRAFPAVPVRTSGGSRVLARLAGSPAVVVATPGAEPYADGGYAAAILLDSWALLSRPSLRAAEETLRRWMNAAALVRPGPDGGSVVVMADAGLPVVQALIRWDPATFADRELAERRELRFPPAARMAALSGPHSAVRALLDAAELPAGAEILGPVPVAGADPGSPAGFAGDPAGAPGPAADAVRFLVRAPRSGGTALAAVLHAGQAARTARKEPGTIRLELDPAELI